MVNNLDSVPAPGGENRHLLLVVLQARHKDNQCQLRAALQDDAVKNRLWQAPFFWRRTARELAPAHRYTAPLHEPIVSAWHRDMTDRAGPNCKGWPFSDFQAWVETEQPTPSIAGSQLIRSGFILRVEL